MFISTHKGHVAEQLALRIWTFAKTSMFTDNSFPFVPWLWWAHFHQDPQGGLFHGSPLVCFLSSHLQGQNVKTL